MQNVLCKLRWHTSAPMSPGRARPTIAFMFAAIQIDLATVLMDDATAVGDRFLEDRRAFDGYVTISAARFCALAFAFSSRSADVDVAVVVRLDDDDFQSPPSPRSRDWSRERTVE